MRRELGTILLALALAGTAACGGGEAASAPEASSSATQAPEGPLPIDDGMEPAEPVLVGEFRFVDACRALDAATVEKIFGTWGARGAFHGHSRTALPEVESGEATGGDSDCTYNLEDKHNQQVVLELDQYATVEAARDAWLSDLEIANGALRKKLEDLQEQVAEGGERSKEAAQMLADLRRQLKVLEKERDGLTLLEADGRPVIFMPSRSNFFALRQNVVIRLTYTFGPRHVYDPRRKISKRELPAAMRKVSKSLAAVSRSLADPQLSQAPVSSIPSGADQLGETRLLEPCALLTPEIFAEVIGGDPYPSLLLESGPWSPRQMIESKYASPACTRHVDDEERGTMMVTLHHTVSQAAAADKLDSLCRPSARKQLRPLDVPGVVGAVRCLDQARASSDRGAFMLGPYVVALNMYDGYLGETFWFQDAEWVLAFELLNERLKQFV